MDARIVTIDGQKMLLLPEELLFQAGLLEEVTLQVTEEGLLVLPRIQLFEDALQQVFSEHHDLLKNLAER
ncbi:hypothetical protein [Deinococcus roseus]|uniref:SpoVT-AbrB domain-containing protein n=1 Tax=Deinococcus roseus TaxID=392414 RepID=A0ABQ2CZY9_9DEIO|nr:hypothetical protein [Deinococcus roseus]GGJ37722.1 hypothetical protein GCM10008938_24770 [Deinococcus roseus]